MAAANANNSAMDIENEADELDFTLYYDGESDSENDEQCDGHTTNQPSILPQLQIESTNAQPEVDESNNLRQSTSKTPDVSANDERYIQPDIELDSNDVPIDMSTDLGPKGNNLPFDDEFKNYFSDEINSG